MQVFDFLNLNSRTPSVLEFLGVLEFMAPNIHQLLKWFLGFINMIPQKNQRLDFYK
jgi:hypothetical protein